MSVETQDADKLRNLTEMAKQMVAQASATGNVLRIPDVIEKFEQYGAEDGGGSPERFAEFIRNETQKWAKVVKDAKVQADA